MTRFLDRFGLTPQERRLVVLASLAVFVVLNLVIVWPRFKDWSALGERLAKARLDTERYNTEITRADEYKSRLKKLEGEGGGVPPGDQANRLQSMIQLQAASSSIIPSITPQGIGANRNTLASQFFEEQAMLVRFEAGDSELINFLVGLGSGDSIVRVRDLSLKPDNTLTKLSGQATVVASFQRRPETRAAAPAAKVPVSASASKIPLSSSTNSAARTPASSQRRK